MDQMWAMPGTAQPVPTRKRRVGRAVRNIVLAMPVLCGLSVGGRAQGTAPSATDHVSPAAAANTLAILRDEKRRTELIDTLETIAKSGRSQTAAPAPATTPAPAPVPLTPEETLAAGPVAATAAPPPAQPPPAPAAAAATVPAAAPAKAADVPPAAPKALAPDSIGVQLASRMSVLLGAYAQQLVESIQSVNDLPLLWRWLRSQADDPQARAEALDALRILVIAVGAGLLVEWLVTRLLRGVRATLDAWSPRHDGVDPSAAGTHAVEVRRRRFDRILRAVRLLPFVVGRLVIDLLPVAALIGVVEVLLGTALVSSSQSRLVVLQAVEGYVLARVILAVTAALASPRPPRLLSLSDTASAFVTRWMLRFTVVGVTGYVIANVGLLFGMYHTAQHAILKLFALIVHLGLIVAVLQVRGPVAERLRAPRASHGVWASLCNRFANIWHWFAIFWIVAAWLVWAVEIRDGYTRLLSFVALTAGIVIGARLIAVLVLGGLDRGRAALVSERLGERAGVYYPFLRMILSAAIWVATGIALLEAWGLPVLFWLTAGGLGGRVLDAGLTIVVAVVLAIVAWEGGNAIAARQLAELSASAQAARAGRLRTLLPLLRTVLLVVIVLIVGSIALSAIGVNIAPLLAGAGVIGIAVGFGSQKLVQDLITGLFLLLENSMQVGDVVTVAGMTGTVEALSIRTIRLRALDGAVHLIPFSAVTTVTNQTRDYAYAVLDVSIGLNEEPGPIETVLREVAAEMQEDAAWQAKVLDKLDVMGVEKLTDAAWIMRVRMKTQPSSRMAVTRELNRRIKMRFDASAIESPFTSHRVLMREPPVPQVASEEAA